VTSANTEYAVEAFEYGVIDFIGKPFKQEHLKAAFERVDGKENSNKQRKYLPIKNMIQLKCAILKILYQLSAEDITANVNARGLG